MVANPPTVPSGLDGPHLISFALYLVLIVGLSLWAWARTQSLGDYLLGGRRLGALVTALSAGASDMSGWLLLGLPGAVYLSGIREAWIGVGLVLGAWANWHWVSQRLRVYTEQAGNALTLPAYLEHRFQDRRRVLRVGAAGVILLFFTFYTAAGLVSGAILFQTSFGVPYGVGVGVGAAVIVGYTFLGGFLAVSWTDAAQGLLMLAALLLGPVLVMTQLGGPGALGSALSAAQPDSLSPWTGLDALGLISLLGWGLGYFGQPHILARFMAARSAATLIPARRLAMGWMVVVLIGAVLTGLAGMAWYAGSPLTNPEAVFITLSRELFNPWIAGLVSAAILAAVMSTIDSQLLVCASVLSEDFYRVFLRRQAGPRELLWVGRGAVVVVAAVAVLIAREPGSRVLDLVAYAWAGFGAAFGPVILLSLYWPAMTAGAALAGMVTGAVTVVVWGTLSGGLFDVYELVPGFMLATVVISLVTRWRPQTNISVAAGFTAMQRALPR